LLDGCALSGPRGHPAAAGGFLTRLLTRRGRQKVQRGKKNFHSLNGKLPTAVVTYAATFSRLCEDCIMSPVSSDSHEVTRLLVAWSKGDQHALEKLTPLVYRELRRLARHYMASERPNHTLQATALVNEAYLRLIDSTPIPWQNRAHFFAVSARVMRRVLVDLARSYGRHKRGGGKHAVSLEEVAALSTDQKTDLIALDDALHRLAKIDTRKAKIVELRFFGGLSVEETATVLEVSTSTVLQDWKLAKMWLLRELGGETIDDS
jgi:RNA polymerase sigma factor (TIGR02999 family)